MQSKSILAIGTLTDEITTSIYANRPRTQSTSKLVLTNNTNSIAEVSVFVFDGSEERLLTRRKIAGGAGKSLLIGEVECLNLTGGYELRIKQEMAGQINYILSGTVTS